VTQPPGPTGASAKRDFSFQASHSIDSVTIKVAPSAKDLN
jgi:hypothetical protein